MAVVVGLVVGCPAPNERKWGEIGCGFCGSEGLFSGGLRREWMGERSGCSGFGEWG